MPGKPLPFYVRRYEDSTRVSSSGYAFPCFVLSEYGWNDYGVRSQFYMQFFASAYDVTEIGMVKIIHKDQLDEYDIEHPIRTVNYLPTHFASIDEIGGGCSLGQDENYYKHLLYTFKEPDVILEILGALNDCALFYANYEAMSEHPCFHSLTRFDSAEQMLRTARLIIYQEGRPDLYQMGYVFHTPYNPDEQLSVQFKFLETGVIPRRIYAVIGENGTGKTNLLNQLTLDYLSRKDEVFNNQRPPYSKIIRVSTSIYDDYTEPEVNNTCDFAYCGIRHHELNNQTMSEVLNNRIKEAIKKLKKEKRIEDGEKKLYKLLKRFLSEEIISEVCESYDFYDNIDYANIISRMSSGESNMFFMLTDILANIKYNSLLLFDELELHMHPNAVTLFMDIVHTLLEDYQSFAIIATHSPLIVRELLGENVYVLERNDNIPVMRRIGMESFAANLTDLYEEIFSNKDTKHYYESILEKLKREHLSYEEVLENLRSDALEPNLNMRLMIMNMFTERHEED